MSVTTLCSRTIACPTVTASSCAERPQYETCWLNVPQLYFCWANYLQLQVEQQFTLISICSRDQYSGYDGIRVDFEEETKEDIDNIDTSATMIQVSFLYSFSTNWHLINFVNLYLQQHTSSKLWLQFLMGNNVLPYNMTIYLAISQYLPLVNE